jgi:hypothetical protein
MGACRLRVRFKGMEKIELVVLLGERGSDFAVQVGRDEVEVTEDAIASVEVCETCRRGGDGVGKGCRELSVY